MSPSNGVCERERQCAERWRSTDLLRLRGRRRDRPSGGLRSASRHRLVHRGARRRTARARGTHAEADRLEGVDPGPCGDHLSPSFSDPLLGRRSQRISELFSGVRPFWVSTNRSVSTGSTSFPRPAARSCSRRAGLAGPFKPFSTYLVSSNATSSLEASRFRFPQARSRCDQYVRPRPASPCPNGSPVSDLRWDSSSLQNPFNLPTLLRVVNEQNPGTPLASHSRGFR